MLYRHHIIFSQPTEVTKQSSGATATATLKLSTKWMQPLDQVSQSPQTSWPRFPIELGVALNVTTTSLSYKLTKILQEGNDTHCTLWKPDQRDIPICICAVADDSFSYVSDKNQKLLAFDVFSYTQILVVNMPFCESYGSSWPQCIAFGFGSQNQRLIMAGCITPSSFTCFQQRIDPVLYVGYRQTDL